MKLNVLLWISVLITSSVAAQNTIPLDGRWLFCFDEEKVMAEDVSKIAYNNEIFLPGTTDQAGLGHVSPEPEMNNQWTFGWRRPVVYEGWAWYSRDIDIPESWTGRHIELFLEQTRSETTIWIDGKRSGETQHSLLTSHRHDLSAELTPGRHTITMLLDNGNKHGIGGSYIRSAMGQGNWQGVAGRVELKSVPSVWIDNVVFTPVNETTASVELKIGGDQHGWTVTAQLIDTGEVIREVVSEDNVFEIGIEGLQMWDEFNPKCYRLKCILESEKGVDIREETIGIRFVGMNENRQITVNGRPIFLRGTVSYNIFPLTGYPSTEIQDWINCFTVYKEWGMNHVRFHSLTPPEAALIAADSLGIYLQCEAPKAGRCGVNKEDDEFHIAEGRRVLENYGNHPSFILMSMGNELAGDVAAIQHIYDEVTRGDGRRLYTTTTCSSKQELKDDYKIYGGIVRGFKGPFTDWDYRETAIKIGQTMLSHEVGQWHTYPDMRQIDKYTGVMRCDNLNIIKEDLEKKGLCDRAYDFTQITGRFAALLYKDEMEALKELRIMGDFKYLR